MLSFRHELPLWTAETCPFCGKETVQMLKTKDGPDVASIIGFYTCLSCDKIWSGVSTDDLLSPR